VGRVLAGSPWRDFAQMNDHASCDVSRSRVYRVLKRHGLIREDCRLAHARIPSPIRLTVRSTDFGTVVPLPEMDVRTMMVPVIRYASYRSARGIRKTDVKPLREGHNVTPARKAHFAKLHPGR
jgi:hypothetical protein